MLPKLRPLLVGMATFVPGVRQGLTAAKQATGLGGAESARYCYSVWLRHVALLARNGLWRQPGAVAELGPGDSLGVGLCALLSGAEAYRALDVMRFASARSSLAVLDELASLFRARAPIPDDAEFPEVTPRLREYHFPAHALPDALLDAALAPQRLDRIRAAIRDVGQGSDLLRYEPAWDAAGTTRRPPVDLVLSQAVLEHVDDLQGTYQALRDWLRPGGVMSHAIDFRCHNMFHEWNGHWSVPEPVWTLVRGRRVYLLNREPLSMHTRLLRANGFVDLVAESYRLPSALSLADLSPRFRSMTLDDLTTGMATIQAARGPS